MKPRNSGHGVRIPKHRMNTYDPVITVVGGAAAEHTVGVNKRTIQ